MNSTSIQKMIVDFEIIRQVKAACAPIEVNEETLNLQEIKEIGHDGSFITAGFYYGTFYRSVFPQGRPQKFQERYLL